MAKTETPLICAENCPFSLDCYGQVITGNKSCKDSLAKASDPSILFGGSSDGEVQVYHNTLDKISGRFKNGEKLT